MKIITCLACGDSKLKPVLDLGEQYAANLLCTAPNQLIRRERLALNICEECGHAQQAVSYPSHDLFSHYLYQSGTSQTLKRYFNWLAQCIASTLPERGRVLELASNDGSFLTALHALGVNAEGVDPAENLVSIANEKGAKTTQGFWPDVQVEGKFNAIVAMNVVAHTSDPHAFLCGVKDALAEDGVAYIQVSQADMFRNCEFDTLYHEHYSFYCPFSLTRLSLRCGFRSIDFIKTDIHGGSILAVLGQNPASVAEAISKLKTPPFFLRELSAQERPSAGEIETFSERAQATCRNVQLISQMAQAAGRKVVLVGVAAKAITVLQASGIVPDVIVDEAPLKIGRYIPNTDWRIESLASLSDIPEPALFIIGAWNFEKELAEKIRRFRPQGDLLAVYFPQLNLRAL
jgi:SAM-dependent methyltransferase